MEHGPNQIDRPGAVEIGRGSSSTAALIRAMLRFSIRAMFAIRSRRACDSIEATLRIDQREVAFDSGHVAFPAGRRRRGPAATVRMIGQVAEPRTAVRGRRRLLTAPSAFAGIAPPNSALIWPHEQRAQATAETDR